MTVLVDSNVLLDVATEDPVWGGWSSAALEAAAEIEIVAINPIVYAEVSIRFAAVEELDRVLPPDSFPRSRFPTKPAFSQARPSSPTDAEGDADPRHRDASRYRTYFPGLDLIAP